MSNAYPLTSPIEVVGTGANPGQINLFDGTFSVEFKAPTTLASTVTATLPDISDTLIGKITTDILSNKTFVDNVTFFHLTGDPTTKFKFDASAITAGQTKTYNLPDDNTFLIGRTSTDTLTNKTFIDASTTFQDDGNSNKEFRFQANSIAPATLITFTVPSASDTLVGRASTDTLTNKTLTFPIITSIMNGGIMSVPSGTDTLVARNTSDTLTNKKLSDLTTFIIDDIDSAKQLTFSLGGAVTSTTTTIVSSQTVNRSLTLPDATDTLVGRNTTDTLTNKTLTSPKIGTKIDDVNGNEFITLNSTGSAVNQISLTNTITGTGPLISVAGDDANTDLRLTAKGTGKVTLSGLKYPNADGTVGQTLITNGSGVLSFATVETFTVTTANTVGSTPVTIDTIATTTGTSYYLTINLIGRRTDNTGGNLGASYGYTIKTAFKNVGGVLTRVAIDKLQLEDSPSAIVDAIVSGTNIIVTVAGQVGSQNISWKAQRTTTFI